MTKYKMSSDFVAKYIKNIKELAFFLKKNMIALDIAKEWVIKKIQSGDDTFIDFLWIQDDPNEVMDFFEDIDDAICDDNCLQQRNKILISWLNEADIPYEDFLKIVEKYYCDVGHPEDLAVFIPYMPKNENYPFLSADTLKEISERYLKSVVRSQ